MTGQVKFVGDRTPNAAQQSEINALLNRLNDQGVDHTKVTVVSNPYNRPDEYAYTVPKDTPARCIMHPKTLTGNSVYPLPARKNMTENNLLEHRGDLSKAISSGNSAQNPWRPSISRESDGVHVGYRNIPRRGGFQAAILVNGRDDAQVQQLCNYVKAKNPTVADLLETDEFHRAKNVSSASRNVLAYKAAKALGYTDDELSAVSTSTLIDGQIAEDAQKMLKPTVENVVYGVHQHTDSHGKRSYVVVQNMANINEHGSRGSVIVSNGPKYGFDVLNKDSNESWTNEHHNVFPTHTAVAPSAASAAKQFEKNKEVKEIVDWDGHMPFHPQVDLEFSEPNAGVDAEHGWDMRWNRVNYEGSFGKYPEPNPAHFQLGALIDHAKRSKNTSVVLRVDSDAISNVLRNWPTVRKVAGVSSPAKLLEDTVDEDHVRIPVPVLEHVA